MGRLLYALIYFLSGFFPRNRRKVLFGAWLGKKFSDNPKYLLLYLTKHQANLDFVWIGEESVRSAIPENLPVRFITRGSLAAWWEMLTAGTCFVTHGFADLGTFNLMRGAKRIYLGHGLAIKHMGSRDSTLTNRLLAALRRCLRNSYSFDFYIASSPAHQVKLLIEYATCNAEIHQILQCGQPRVDYLLENSMPVKSENFRNRFFATNGFPQSYRVITYLPTFRDKNSRIFSFTALDPKQRTHLDELLVKLNAVILEKNHFADVLRGGAQNQISPGRVFALSGLSNIDTQELLLMTDLLVTDYSGCYVDFLMLDRPILHFAYDRQYYEKADRGLYFNLDEVAGGAIVGDFETLCKKIEECLLHPDRDQDHRQKIRSALAACETGESCQKICRSVIGNLPDQLNLNPANLTVSG